MEVGRSPIFGLDKRTQHRIRMWHSENIKIGTIGRPEDRTVAVYLYLKTKLRIGFEVR